VSWRALLETKLWSAAGLSTVMTGLQEEQDHLRVLQTRFSGLCLESAGVLDASKEDELQELVQREIAKLEAEEREALLSLVRLEYENHQDSADRRVTPGRRLLPPLSASMLRLPSLSPAGSATDSPKPDGRPRPLTRSGSWKDRLSSASLGDGDGSGHPRGDHIDGQPSKVLKVATPALKLNRVNTRAACVDETPDADAIEGQDEKECVWVQANTNAFGAFIHVGLQSGLKKAFLNCLILVVTAVTIQLIFSEELITNHVPSLDIHSINADSICWIPWKFQLSAVVIFITLVLQNVPGMTMAARLVFLSTHHKLGDGEDVGDLTDAQDSDEAVLLNVPFWRRFVIFVVAVLSEWVTVCIVLYAGCLFAITANSVDNVIRSTVSVMFVLNVDEIVFDSCCPSKIADDLKETEYLIPKVKAKASTVSILLYYYTLYGHLPLIISVSCAVVFSMRSLPTTADPFPVSLVPLCLLLASYSRENLRSAAMLKCFASCDVSSTHMNNRAPADIHVMRARMDLLRCSKHPFVQDEVSAMLLSSY
jgi:hypothetical protein